MFCLQDMPQIERLEFGHYKSSKRLCRFDTQRQISRVSDGAAKVVDGGLQRHFSEL